MDDPNDFKKAVVLAQLDALRQGASPEATAFLDTLQHRIEQMPGARLKRVDVERVRHPDPTYTPRSKRLEHLDALISQAVAKMASSPADSSEWRDALSSLTDLKVARNRTAQGPEQIKATRMTVSYRLQPIDSTEE